MFEKEAEEYVPNINWHDFSSKDLREEMMLCYRKGAEFGYNKALEEATHNYNAIIADYDKRIAELEEENAELKKQLEMSDKVYNDNLDYSYHIEEQLTDRVNELEAQIEKMKCCGNCAKRGHICVVEEMQGNLCGKNKDKWELRR